MVPHNLEDTFNLMTLGLEPTHWWPNHGHTQNEPGQNQRSAFGCAVGRSVF